MMLFGVYYFPTNYGMDIAELAQAVEGRGLESLFVCEHTHIPASAVDLKFLPPLPRVQCRNFKSKNRTRIITLLVSLLIPKFASEGVASTCELRNRDTSRERRQTFALS